MVGVKFEFYAKDPNDYGLGGKLTNQGSYDFVSLDDSNGAKPTHFMFSFEDPAHNDADTAPICDLDRDGYKKILMDAGLEASTHCGEHGHHLAWNF